jgi:hypothetical protein
MTTISTMAVFGFDRRILPFMTAFRFTVSETHLLSQVDRGPPYPATISPQVWLRPKDIDEIPSNQLNQVNLSFLPEESVEKSVQVAFSVAKSVIDDWPREPSILPIPEVYLFPERGWRVLGYDIVDSGLQFSAIYGLRMLTPEVCRAAGCGDDLLNRHGLVANFEMALKLKHLFDDIDPVVHAYYQVVKVHVKVLL